MTKMTMQSCGKRTVFLIKILEIGEEMILDLEPHLVHKISSRWIVDLNVKSKMVKHIENNRISS